MTEAEIPSLVIFLHGLSRTARAMRRLEAAASHAGYRTLNWDYPGRRRTLPQLVEMFREVLAGLDEGDRRVHFVTHSLGGLIVRGALTREPATVVPGRIVMIGPPNKGVDLPGRGRLDKILGWLYGKPLLDVATRPEIMDALGVPEADLGIIAGTRQFHLINPSSWVTAWLHRNRRHDGTVEVERTQLDEMDDFIEVDANHTYICDDPEVIRQVIFFLEHGAFAATHV
jgi:pimeloyl-ACP methyl ester carboxylesterase